MLHYELEYKQDVILIAVLQLTLPIDAVREALGLRRLPMLSIRPPFGAFVLPTLGQMVGKK